MAAGTIPIVYKAGGYREIITSGENGFLYDNKNELLKITRNVVHEAGCLKKISKTAINESKKYSYEKFKNEINKII